MWNDIRIVVDSCIQCLRFDVKKEGFHPARTVEADQPWDHVELDLIGPLPVSDAGYSHIMTIVDVCTGYTILRPLKSTKMEEVARQMWTIIAEYGPMKILQTDNGPEFANSMVEQLSSLYGVEHRFSTPYHPRANGLVERQNKEVGRHLKKLMVNASGRWEDLLPMVQMSINCMEQSRTKTMPFVLMFGRIPNLFEDFSEVKPMEDWGISFFRRLEKLELLKKAVLPGIRDYSKDVRSAMVQRLNTTRKQLDELPPGTRVMVVDQTRGGKWEPRFEGPFTVEQRHSGGAYTLLDAAGNPLAAKRTVDMMLVLPMRKPETKEDRLEKDQHWEVFKVLDHRVMTNNCGYEYLVRWKGFGAEDDSWVPATDFDGLKVIKTYWRALARSRKTWTPKKPGRRPKGMPQSHQL